MAWHCGKVHCPTHSSPEHACPAWALSKIAHSVGAGGDNDKSDVRIIQGALNRIVNTGGTNERFTTDGVVTPNMLDTIRLLQPSGLGMAEPDGKIDPGGQTFRMLAHTLKLKRIVVSLKEQYLEAFDDGRKIFRFPCMTGATDHPTDPGVFKIFNKDEKHRSRA